MIVVSVLICLLAGCGTICNMAQEGGPQVYGGVAFDIALIGKEIQNPAPSPEQANLMGVIDFPLSLIGDTITLPITLLANRRTSSD